MPDLSVIICTHNPRSDYLARVLDALKEQTLPKEQWELLLIDNASKELLEKTWNLSWHPHAHHLREDEIGLTPARLRGIRDSQGDLLVFVDDDNVLSSDYLFHAEQISSQWPILGVWGGGAEAEFESPPSDWTRPFWRSLAIRPLCRDTWSNVWLSYETVPYGAGMCVRREIAETCADRVSADSLRRRLDRRGGELNSGGDIEFVFTAFEEGFGAGRFHRLQLAHLIPADRLKEDYLLRLEEGHSYSDCVLQVLHGVCAKVPVPSMWRLAAQRLRRILTASRRDRRFFEARLRGQRRAAEELAARLKL